MRPALSFHLGANVPITHPSTALDDLAYTGIGIAIIGAAGAQTTKFKGWNHRRKVRRQFLDSFVFGIPGSDGLTPTIRNAALRMKSVEDGVNDLNLKFDDVQRSLDEIHEMVSPPAVSVHDRRRGDMRQR